jgi:LmbE family N-acetylglucosaminyl deacetylase
MISPRFQSRSRVMMFAPHPDDESLATGVLLQRAVNAGAEVRVVYATDGERNCWPQRVLEGKVWLRDIDRRRWGARRRAEALAALQVLGIEPARVFFLGLPDQGLTDMLLQGRDEVFLRIVEAIRLWDPTHLLLPSAADTHPDHSALAVLLEFALQNYLPGSRPVVRLHYLVHGRSEAFARGAFELAGSALEQKAKLRAIRCHFTQIALSRKRFLSYAQRPERFIVGERDVAPGCDGPIQSSLRDRDQLRLDVAFTLKPLRADGASLYLLGYENATELRRLRTVLPGRSARIDLIDCDSGAIVGVGRYHGDAFRGEILLPLRGFDSDRDLFVKLDRRVWFFDEVGWMQIAAPVPQEAAVSAELAVA